LITGKVVAIADGDTLTVLDDSKVQHKIRLAGIDAPESKQPFGAKSRENLAGKVFGKVVRVDVIDVDRYRRQVGRIYLGDRFVNLEMVRDGFAWRYPQYDKPGEFTAAECEAREKRRGLWADRRSAMGTQLFFDKRAASPFHVSPRSRGSASAADYSPGRSRADRRQTTHEPALRFEVGRHES
jgi:endonuclease YncB( thermonuclease family)